MSPIDQIDLADIYANAGLTVDPDRFAGRQSAVTSLIKNPDIEIVIGLAALAFGLPATVLADRIVSTVRETDPSFAAKSNAREIQILAVGALEVLTGENLEWTEGMHAVLALSACSQRVCEVDGGLAARMEGRRLEVAVSESDSMPSTAVPTTNLNLTGLQDQLAELAPLMPQGSETTLTSLKEAFKIFGDLINANNAAFSKKIQTQLSAIGEKLQQQQSEIELLWWLFGGWSDALEAPFETFEPETRALLVGIDLGRLSNLRAGPAAVSTFAERAVGSFAKTKRTASLKQIVGALEPVQLEKLGLSDFDLSNLTTFPVLGALKLRQDRGVSADEASLYKDIVHLDIDKKTPILEWSKHIYHEMIIARCLLDEV